MQADENLQPTHCWLTDIDPILYPAKLITIGIAFIVAAVVMLGWNSPSVASLLPSNWFLMQATTALGIMLIAYSLLLKVSIYTNRTKHIQQLLAVLAIIVLSCALYTHITGQAIPLGQYLVATQHLQMVHPTSLQSASSLLLLALLLLLNEKSAGALGYLFTALLLTLFALITIFISSYLFSALNLISASSAVIISKQTLTCIILLFAVTVTIRAPYGAYKVLFNTSLGGRFSRQFLFVAIVMVLLVLGLEASLLEFNNYSIATINAIVLTTDILLLFFIIIIAGNSIEAQSEKLAQLTITDKLTETYNLRGLHLHAEHKLKDAHRRHLPLSVLLFDLDGLKIVNDTLGHEIGSDLIKTFATALKNTFRSNDIVARVGGDEFVVISMEDTTGVDAALARVASVIEDINQFSKHPYQMSYSVGMTALNLSGTQTIDDLIKIADEKMYVEKRKKKAERLTTP